MKQAITTLRLPLAVVLASLLLAACATSPTGRTQLTLLSEAKLAKMGNATYQHLRQKLPVSHNRNLNRYVQCVASAIIEQASTITHDLPAEWDVTVFKKDVVNAFALPGGNIAVYTGLLDVAEGPAQLATVIGHEVAHLLADHANARASAQLATKTVLGVVSAILGGGGQLVMAALGVGAQVGVLLPYSRAQESEADLIGLKLMARAGFNPRAAVALWRNMAQASGASVPEFLSTHPSDQSRINDLQSHIPEVMPAFQRARAHGRNPSCGPVPPVADD